MEQQKSALYAFDNFRVDAAKRLAYKEDGEALPLKAKAFDTLLYLIEHSGTVVERDDLLSAIWADTVVEENNLTQHISTLRRVFGEKPGDHRYIVTIPGHGYKFVADVRDINRSEAEPASSAAADADRIDDRGVKLYPAFFGRPWLISLAMLILLGLSTAGFFIWRENAGRSDAKAIRSIAVLPFKPMAAENRDESLEMGMADTLILKLGGGDQLTVRPLSAVRRFGSLEQNSVEAGRTLGVDAVLEGNIQAAGDRVRVSAKLIRVDDGKQMWAGQFDERSADIFTLQDSISNRVARALQITLGNRGVKKYTNSVEAYQLYMKGNFHTSRLILPEVQKGIAYYEQAIAVDPSYAMAYVGIANASRAMVLTNDARPTEVMPKAKAAALKAVELDNELAEAHNGLGTVAFWYDYDWQMAEKHHLRALEIDPDSAQSHFAYAHMLSNTGRHEQAIAEIQRTRELDPVSLVTNALEGQILFFAGKDDEALRVLQATAEMEPNFWLAHLFLTRIYIKRGMYPEATAAATRARDLSRGNAEAAGTIAYALARSGRVQEALDILKELESRAAERYVASYALAQIYNGLGDKEKALDLLEKAYAEKDALMVFLKVEPKWDNLRAEPRFIELMKRMNF